LSLHGGRSWRPGVPKSSSDRRLDIVFLRLGVFRPQ